MELFIVNCPRRVLAQTAKTRGGTLEVPAYRDENLAVAENISIFQEQGSQRIAEKYAKDCRNFAGGRINTGRILGAESRRKEGRKEGSFYHEVLKWKGKSCI